MGIDLYCERLGPGLRPERLNPPSSGVFLAVTQGIRAMTLRSRGRLDRGLRLLVGRAPLLASDRPSGQTGPQAWQP